MKLVKEYINFERGVDPKSAMNTGVKAEIQFLLNKFVHEELILGKRRQLNIFWAFYNDKEGNFYFHSPASKSMTEPIIKEYFEPYLEFPGEYVQKRQGGYTTKYKIKEPYIPFFDVKSTTLLKGMHESLSFQRGLDPKKSMKTGKYDFLYNDVKEFMSLLTHVEYHNASVNEFPWNFFMLPNYQGLCYKYGKEIWYYAYFGKIQKIYFSETPPENIVKFSLEDIKDLINNGIHFDHHSMDYYERDH